MASSSVPITLGLAGLSKPMWLSLICRKVSLPGWAASAPSMIPSESGTPPEIVHSTPVPAQVMHSNTFRRLTPAFPLLFVESLMVVLRPRWVNQSRPDQRRDLFPDHGRVKTSTHTRKFGGRGGHLNGAAAAAIELPAAGPDSSAHPASRHTADQRDEIASSH